MLDPVEFLQPQRRLFIDTNIFMDADPHRAGGLKRLFERGQGSIVAHSNPIVVPTKVIDELTKQSRRDISTASGERTKAAIKKAASSLLFLEEASRIGLVRKDLGHRGNPYADNLFLRIFEQFAEIYEMCLLTRDITIMMRIRLLSYRLDKRILAAMLTKDGDLEIESNASLLSRGLHKYARHAANIARGEGNFGDTSEVATLERLIHDYRQAFDLEDYQMNPRGPASSAPGRNRSTRPPSARPFSARPVSRAPDTGLVVTSVPREGDDVTWESAHENGTLMLGPLLGEGGEGAVYEGSHGTVVKIFDKDHVTQHRKSKIELFVLSELHGQGFCIPSAFVRNSVGEFVGYVMPKVSGREARTIFNIKKLESRFPDWKKSDLVEICISFLEQVEYLHSMNIIIGDINPKNLMIDDRRSVSIIDADSWQFEGYPCPVGTPMYTSPAMLGKSYADDLRSMEDELFALATMLFQIVMTGQFPYMRTGAEGDMVQLIREGNFAFQYENRNNKDQPDGDWKYIWSHLHKPVKDLFWHTFHKEGDRYWRRPTASEWLEAFKGYRAYLCDSRSNFDPMSNDVRPVRHKAFRPDTPIQDCPVCDRKDAIAGVWKGDDAEYFIPRQCTRCRDAQRPTRRPASAAMPVGSSCKDCGRVAPRRQLSYGRCAVCSAKAKRLDSSRLCVDCRQPFISYGHISWFQGRSLDVPKSHAAIKQACSPAMTSSSSSTSWAAAASSRPVTTQAVPPPQASIWSRVLRWLLGD